MHSHDTILRRPGSVRATGLSHFWSTQHTLHTILTSDEHVAKLHLGVPVDLRGAAGIIVMGHSEHIQVSRNTQGIRHLKCVQNSDPKTRSYIGAKLIIFQNR